MEKSNYWYLLGMIALGLLIGLLVGMSLTPVVSTVLGLLFAFAGGSVVATIKNKTTQELRFLGQCITSVSLSIILGAAAGIYVREYDWGQKESLSKSAFSVKTRLSVDDIVSLSKSGVDESVLLTLLQLSSKKFDQQEITKEQLTILSQEKVKPIVIRGMLDTKVTDNMSAIYFTKEDILKLQESNKDTIEILKQQSNNMTKNNQSGFSLFNNTDKSNKPDPNSFD